MVEINLLPQQYRKNNEPNGWRLATYALIPVTIAAILIPEVVTATRVGDLQKQRDALQGEVVALTAAKQEFDALTATETQLKQVTDIATQLRDRKTYWSNDLATFTAQLPAGSNVALTSMNVRPVEATALTALQQTGVYIGKNVQREIELSGTARSQQAVVNFLNAYETNPKFGVNFRSLQNDQATGTYTFAATVGMVGAEPVAAAPTDAAGAAGAPAAAPVAPATGATQ
ncbi:fimbrial assembly protein [Deinococcus sp. QL22]|uniref:fimbrial assembly protein n=1 Tax=Deinococcus sp. QL22 TaxID=2939437 RepID=UPI002016EF60|nr:fimbrial assembly protein [Deinococcus sp. QL22]UQN07048.1 fimbrial assembly protein [Deinococcus sp. QL22]